MQSHSKIVSSGSFFVHHFVPPSNLASAPESLAANLPSGPMHSADAGFSLPI